MTHPCSRISLVGLCLLGVAACGPDNDDGNQNNNQNLCDGVQCGANAHCVSSSGDCACDEGFAGDPVQGCTAVVPCEADTCSGHGTCDDTSGTPVCTCNAGYSGAACDACAVDYDLVSGSCVSSQLVDCADITPPANSQQVESQVTITFSTAGGWTTPADCGFACNTDYDLVAGACVDSQVVDCADITPPANAHQVESQDTITYTTAGGWTTPKYCEWACDTNYDLVSGACIDSQQVDCVDITAPANAHQVDGQVTITFTTAGGWSTPADCGFACDMDYALVSGACVDSQVVDCADITPPLNAHQVESQVTITYTTSGGWTTPASCAWACNADYALVSGACINSQQVPCADITPPPNAHQVESQVTITYTTSGGWTTPAFCAWACDVNYHQVAETCVQNVSISWCNTQWPSPSYSRGVTLPETIFGQIYSTTGAGTAAAGPLPGVLARLCYSDTAPTYPTDLSAMTCLDATFNANVGNNDEYMVDLAIDQPGTYYYLFAFSGDGGTTFTVCDTGGIEDDPVEPGEATITGCNLSGWTLRQASSTVDWVLPAGTILQAGDMLVVGRDSDRAAFQTFWGVTMGNNVTYLDSEDTIPLINGAETYTVLDDTSTVVDGPTVAMTSGQSLKRVSSGPADVEGNWVREASATGTPGTTALSSTGAGVLISEFSDAGGTGNFIYEFVELYCDNP